MVVRNCYKPDQPVGRDKPVEWLKPACLFHGATQLILRSATLRSAADVAATRAPIHGPEASACLWENARPSRKAQIVTRGRVHMFAPRGGHKQSRNRVRRARCGPPTFLAIRSLRR